MWTEAPAPWCGVFTTLGEAQSLVTSEAYKCLPVRSWFPCNWSPKQEVSVRVWRTGLQGTSTGP